VGLELLTSESRAGVLPHSAGPTVRPSTALGRPEQQRDQRRRLLPVA